MKNIKIIEKTVKISLLTMAFLSCVKDGNFATPTVDCIEKTITVTNTLQQVKSMYTYGGATIIDEDIIIEGYVVSSDKSGNIYKSISIQDQPENPTAAIKISIDQTHTYTKYNIGRKIYVKLKGLAIGYSFGSLQIGKVMGGDLEGIPALETDDYIVRSCEVATIVPKKIAIPELHESMLEMLLEIENVQFKTSDLGKSYANVNNTATVNRSVESFGSNCNLLGTTTLRNSGYASFKNELLPEGNGSIVAVFGNYYNDFQLYIRDTEDVKLTNDRCNYSNAFEVNTTILQVKEMYTGNLVEFGVSDNYVLEGYVVSSDENGNFSNKISIQDQPENPTAGIQILIDQENVFEQYPQGSKVFVKLDQLYMAKKEGILSIGYPNGNQISAIESSQVAHYIYNSGENASVVPTEITINAVSNSVYENTLVTVKNVQLLENELGSAFTYFSGTNNGVRILETCSEPIKLEVFTSGTATFANNLFPEGHGAITGVLGNYLELISASDVQFNQPYEDCPVLISKLMITEIADPKNSTSARFVELYNASDFEMNLTGWELHKYTNGATTASSNTVDLTGVTVPKNEFVIIANTGYATVFSDTPTFATSYISGNGDDVYTLVDNTGTIVDVFGVVGVDGNGTQWEYLDGRAVRNSDIVSPNSQFTASEWTVFSAASNTNINHPNTPQNAPNDFNPRIR